MLFSQLVKIKKRVVVHGDKFEFERVKSEDYETLDVLPEIGIKKII